MKIKLHLIHRVVHHLVIHNKVLIIKIIKINNKIKILIKDHYIFDIIRVYIYKVNYFLIFSDKENNLLYKENLDKKLI